LFKFTTPQKIVELGAVKIGGQPGELPTAMVGSIFYHGDKIVKDEKTGLFDRGRAENLLKAEEELSDRTGNPRVIDVVGSYSEALIRYVDFVAEHTDSPFLVDGITADVRIPAIKHAVETGLNSRALYNTVCAEVKPEELQVLHELKVKSAVILAFNPRKPTVDGRLEALAGTQEKPGLIQQTVEAGVQNILIDLSVLDVPDVGPAAKAVYLCKERFGYPAGCAPANAVDMWKKTKAFTQSDFATSHASLLASTIVMGANFVMYGPTSRADISYQAVAVADAIVAYTMRQMYRTRPLTERHPLFKIF